MSDITLNLIVDECIAKSTIMLLKQLSFEIIQIKLILGRGADDEEIFAYACQKQIPLLTHDRRFGKIFFDSHDIPTTTIVLHELRPHPKTTNELLKNALAQLDLQDENMMGKLIIVSATIRIRDKMNE